MARITGTAHTGFTVLDMQKTLEFWVGKLHGKLLVDTEIEGDKLGTGVMGAGADSYARLKMAVVNVNGYEIEFFQYLIPESAPYHGNPSIAGSAHLAFYVDDLEEMYSELKEQGVIFHSDINLNMEEDKVTSKWVYLRDPNNICMELIQTVK